MTQTPDTPAEISLPTDTTPTWEIELLISGALTFASLQLPSLLEGWFFAWEPKVPESVHGALVMAYLFSEATATVLAITFSIHILLRGLWAAALGLHSVYPDGVLWERITSGPIFRRVAIERSLTMPQFISRLDNAASIGFAFGGVLLQMTLISGIAALLFFIAQEAVARATGVSFDVGALFLGLAAVPALLILAASQADRRIGHRVPPDSRTGRLIERFARIGAAVSLPRITGPTLMVFTSRFGQVRGAIGLVLLLYAVLGGVLARSFVRLGVWELDGYRFLADEGAGVIDPAHYGDQRSGASGHATTPFIPSETVSGGFLRVFVPYRIEQFDAALERACPDAIAAAESADTAAARAGRAAVLACLGGLLALRVDDVPVPGVTWYAATDAESDLRGLVTRLPIGDLPDGLHTLSLTRLPRRKHAASAAKAGRAPDGDRHEIPFWIDRAEARPYAPRR